MTVDNHLRTYRLHLPPNATNRDLLPLVIILHGHGDNAENFEASTGMSDKADAEHFIAVYPQAMGDPSDWHSAVDGPADQDDVDFVREIIHTMTKQYHVDPTRIFAAGHSNGGFMVYRLASLLSEDIAAIGVTAGSIGNIDERGDTLRISQPRRPVSVIHFHGQADPSVPYNGGDEDDGPDNIVSAPNTIRFWLVADGCPKSPTSHTVSANKNVIIDSYTPCARGTAVVFYTIVDGQHRWPGDDIPWWTFPNREITDVNATDVMWDFFRAHPKIR
jgi:polyhydroxybutyrate depolymerase